MGYDGWEPISEIGKGGQGTVHKSRSPTRAQTRRDALAQLQGWPPLPPEELARVLRECSRPDEPDEIGALKQFEIPTGTDETEKALGRLKAEVHALESLNNPGILKLLHSNIDERFIVTEFHGRGALSADITRYKGNALEALNAFRILVSAVTEIHKLSLVHRDIKPENIFVANDGRLVLGDFGIVFFSDAERRRVTSTFGEKVGTGWWMPPWAFEEQRLLLEDIDPSFDIYPLGKVLWSMIAGRPGFRLWYYDDPKNDLTKMFPDDPAMPVINEKILSKCVVEHKRDLACPDGRSLHDSVKAVIDHLTRASKPAIGPWPCRICGAGHYVKEELPVSILRTTERNDTVVLRHATYVCDNNSCKHVEFFRE